MTRVASIRVWKPFEVTGEGPRGYKSNLYPRRILGVSFRTAVSETLAYNEEQFFFIFFFSPGEACSLQREIAPSGKVPSQGDRKSAESSYGEMARLCSRFQAV